MISVSITIVNLIIKNVLISLSNFEKHKSFTDLYLSRSLKYSLVILLY